MGVCLRTADEKRQGHDKVEERDDFGIAEIVFE